MHIIRYQLLKLDLQNFLLIKLQSCMFFCLGTGVSNTVIKLSTSSSAMCCCLVPSVCKLSQCLMRSCYVSFLLRSMHWAVTFHLCFFIQVTDTSVCRFWSAVCLLPVLTSTIKGHKEQSRSGVRRSVAALQLRCCACSVHFALLFLKRLRHWLCFLLLSSPCWRPQSPC